MKQLICLISAALAFAVQISVGSAEDKRAEKPMFKGVELYSWKDNQGDWLYVMLPGTNRNKTEEEVKAARNQIKGADNLIKELGLLAIGENVFWMDMKGFELPPKETREKVAKAAKTAKIELDTTNR